MTEVSMVVSTGAYTNWLEIEPLLGKLTADGQTPITKQVAAIASELPMHSEYRVVLLYSDFPSALSQILRAENTDINEAIEEWKANLIALQNVYRSYRNQVLLFELNDVIANPQHFLKVCWGEWQLANQVPFCESIAGKESDFLVNMLAEKYLEKDTIVAQANQYARAMAWPLGKKTQETALNIEQKLQQLQQLFIFKDNHQLQINTIDELQKKAVELERVKEKTVTEVALLKEESTLLLEQLHTVQEEIENSHQEQKLRAQQLEVLEKEKDQLTASTKSLNNKNSLLTEESNLLLEQLHIVQEELEQKFIAKRDSENKHNFLQKERDQLEKTLKEIQLESAKKQAQLEKKLKDIQFESTNQQAQLQKEFSHEKAGFIAENKVLLEQLHLAQEELEIHYLKKIEEDEKAKAKADEEAAQHLLSTETAVMVVEQPKVEPTVVRSSGFLERRAQRKAKQRALRRAAERATVISQSVWFNRDWYLTQNPDVAADPLQASDPALHYMRSGGFEGRKPSPHFDSAFYLAENPDVAESGMNPLWHFLQNGQAEGRQPHP